MAIKTQTLYTNVVNSSDDMGYFVNHNPLMLQSIKISNDNSKERFTVEAKKHLPFIKKSFESIVNGIKNNESFLILPDYDADGTVSGFLYYNLLSLLKEVYHSKSLIRIKPTARDEGYGISQKFFESTLHNNVDNIITTDIGISVEFPMSFISSKKKIIIFDHHTPLSSIWFSIKEFKHFYLEKHPNANLTNKTIEDLELLKSELTEFFKNYPTFSQEFRDKFIMNNYVLNHYPNYYDFFEQAQIQDKSKDSLSIQWNYDKIFYSSAWELAVSVYEYALDYLISNNLLKGNFKDLIHYIGIGWAITAISDVTDLSSCNNMYFFLHWQKVVRHLQKELSKKDLEPTKDSVLGIILKTLKIEEFKDWYPQWLEQIGYFLSWVLSFKGKFSHSDLGFSICPSINAYGRVSLMHSLYLEWIIWYGGVPRTNKISFNETRKQLQASIAKQVLKDIKENKRYAYPVVIGGVKEQVSDGDIEQAYWDLKSYFASHYSDVFLDYVWRNIRIDQVEEIETNIMKNHEWVFGIIASKVAEMYKKPTFVWKYCNETQFKGSWRSIFSLFDLGCSTFQSVSNIWWHAAAFGISLNNVNSFLEEITNKMNTLTDEEKQKLYTIKMDVLINIKPNVKDILTFERFFSKFNGFVKSDANFKAFENYKLENLQFLWKEWATVKLLLKDWDNEITFMIWDYLGFCEKYWLEIPKIDVEGDWEKEKQTFSLNIESENWWELIKDKLLTENLTISDIQTQGMRLEDEKYINTIFFVW